LYLGRGKQNIDNFVRVFHDAPDCRSNEYFKGVMDDRSRAVFQGRIVVAQGAQKTDAQQQNRNLLLSRNAEVDTKPQLEIYADDVKCSHGATIGQLAEESIYYLRSRGIGMAEARQLLTFAFANDLMDQVPETALRSYIESLLAARLQVELKS